MPYVNVPNDLSKIKTKLAFNLTKRQLFCFGAAAAIGVPTYLLARAGLGNTMALFLMIILMLPCFLLAMYERDGLPFEKVVRNVARAVFLWPSARPYKTENFYAFLVKQAKADAKEVQRLETTKKARQARRTRRPAAPARKKR